MAVAIINGRRVNVPDVVIIEQIREAGGIKPGRRIIRRTRTGNYPVQPSDRINVNDSAGNVFVDAPARIKGFGI